MFHLGLYVSLSLEPNARQYSNVLIEEPGEKHTVINAGASVRLSPSNSIPRYFLFIRFKLKCVDESQPSCRSKPLKNA